MPILLFLLAIGCSGLMLAGFREGLHRSALPPQQQQRPFLIALALTSIWFVAVGLLGIHGFFANFNARLQHFPLALLIPVVVLTYATSRTASVAAVLRGSPLQWLLYFQSFRILVELLLWMGFKLGTVPVQMTLEGRNIDILIGLTAPIVAWLCQRYRSFWLGLLWNIAGLAILLNVVVIALRSMPTPLRVFMNAPSAAALATFPMIYLPAVLVPLAYAAHLLSIRQLLMRKAALN